jgi:hypothetical protein
MSVRTIVCATSVLGLLVAAPASAQQCNNANQRGTESCPTYTAPATTAVPRASMGGSMTVGPGPATLFNGAVPPNGFMVQLNGPSELGNYCWVNDNGPANANTPTGFLIGGVSAPFTPWPFMFVTPPGYKPIGAVSIWCNNSVYIETRGW